MPSGEEKTPDSLLEVWSNPYTTYITTGLALIAVTVKFVELLLAPELPDWVRWGLWVFLALALLLFIVHRVVVGVNKLVKDAIERQMPQGDLPVRADDEVIGDKVAGEVAYVFNSRLYGRAYEELIVHCTIRKDGSAAFRREAELIAHSTVNDVDIYMVLPEALQNDKEQLQLAGAASLTDFVQVTGKPTTGTPTRPVNIVMKEKWSSSGQLYLVMSFSPELSSGQRVRYQVIEESMPGLYAVTGQEERKMPYDYFAWDITNPTKKLEMKVFFPEGVRPQSFGADVWHALGQGMSTQGIECDRVKEFLIERREGVFQTLVFTVPYPIIGLTYVVRWIPPKVS
jgi:hypothetical protein